MNRIEIRDEIIKFYDELLLKDYGISFIEAEQKYAKIGNTTGIHSDSLYFLLKMIDYFKIKNLVEIGSGFSTLFFAQISKLRKLEFQSFEEKQSYLEMTRELLTVYDLDPYIINTYKADRIPLKPGFIFLDGTVAVRQNYLRRTRSMSVSFVIVDDFEILSDECSQYMKHSNKPFFFVYGGSRTHRHQFISYPKDLRESFFNFIYEFPAF